MKLPPLDLEAMRKAMLQANNRGLSRSLLASLGPSLATLHTRPERVPLLVACVTELLEHTEAYHPGDYSLLVLPHLLLGVGWWKDPACGLLTQVDQAPGLRQQERLALLAEHTITHRQQLEKQLSRMHDITLSMLEAPAQRENPNQLWHALAQLMTLRGIAGETHQDSYRQYEADAFDRYGLALTSHQALSGNQLLAYQHYGMRIPQPSDDLRQLDPLSRHRVLMHIALAITFGRFFNHNPLFSPWVQPLEELQCPRERGRQLARELNAHQHALKDALSHA
ncbi:hypothetical protein [Pseudomonas sp. REB1044]|uniref:hypothetical protein n=1 Tax=Pseudomonas sp. REB1044 TaxID=2675224 RepID=UPI00315D2BCA